MELTNQSRLCSAFPYFGSPWTARGWHRSPWLGQILPAGLTALPGTHLSWALPQGYLPLAKVSGSTEQHLGMSREGSGLSPCLVRMLALEQAPAQREGKREEQALHEKDTTTQEDWTQIVLPWAKAAEGTNKQTANSTSPKSPKPLPQLLCHSQPPPRAQGTPDLQTTVPSTHFPCPGTALAPCSHSWALHNLPHSPGQRPCAPASITHRPECTKIPSL